MQSRGRFEEAPKKRKETMHTTRIQVRILDRVDCSPRPTERCLLAGATVRETASRSAMTKPRCIAQAWFSGPISRELEAATTLIMPSNHWRRITFHGGGALIGCPDQGSGTTSGLSSQVASPCRTGSLLSIHLDECGFRAYQNTSCDTAWYMQDTCTVARKAPLRAA